MVCPKCNYELKENVLYCPKCNTNILKYKFYQDKETKYEDEESLFMDIQNGTTSISMFRSTAYEATAAEHRVFAMSNIFFAIIISIGIIIYCIVRGNFLGLIGIPFVLLFAYSRITVGFVLLALFILSFAFSWPEWIIVSLGCCLFMKCYYSFWMSMCASFGKNYITRKRDLFYIYWYSCEIALKIDGAMFAYTKH